MTKLFIEDNRIELDRQVEFAITRQFEELSNPTIVLNEWTKTVEIPFSKTNNEIFGRIYNPDKIILDNPTEKFGIYFNPFQKLNFRLEWDDFVLMEGYAKMTSITRKNGTGYYNVTLNGELGRVLQLMKRVTLNDTKKDDPDYFYIDGSRYVNAEMTRTIVKDCWDSAHYGNVPLSSATILDIIGFAPNNSYDSDFDYKSYQRYDPLWLDQQTVNLKEMLESSTTFQNIGINADDIIGNNGMLPKDFGEYRSYNQLPYANWKQLWSIYQEKCEEVTGYEFDMDPVWFNSKNPYWNNMVLMLKSLGLRQLSSFTNRYSIPNSYFISTAYTPSSMARYGYRFGSIDVGFSVTGEESIIYNDVNKYFEYGNPYRTQTVSTVNVNFACTLNRNLSADTIVRISDYAGVVVELISVDDKRNESKIGDAVIVGNGSNLPSAGYDKAVVIPNATLRLSGQTIQTSFTMEIDSTKVLKNSKVVCRLRGVDDGSTESPYLWSAMRYTEHGIVWDGFEMGNIYTSINSSLWQVAATPCRSEARFTLNDLWDNEYTIYDMVLNYCRMFRILLKVDNVEKKLKFIYAPDYFSEYEIEDWTNKLVGSKDFVITPSTTNSRYVLYNYKDNETELGKEYREKLGVDFGELKLVTQYNFSDDTKKLFDNEVPTILEYTDNNMSLDDLVSGTMRYVVTTDVIPYVQDKDKKHVNQFGAFMFYGGVTSWDRNDEYRFRQAYITDDTEFQVLRNTYMYSSLNEAVSADTYPRLSLVNGNNMCTFNVPSKNYTYDKNRYNNKRGIYENIWKNYMNEHYNSQNKLITCYLKLTPQDFINFDFKKFVKIENQLYFVNKIYDYNISSNEATKVDLITVNSMDGYTTNDYSVISTSTSSIGIHRGSSSGFTAFSMLGGKVTASAQGITFQVNGENTNVLKRGQNTITVFVPAGATTGSGYRIYINDGITTHTIRLVIMA